MATTYRAAFGDPHAQTSVANSLGLIGRPDTSCDAAVAQVLAEDEREAVANQYRPASPTGIWLHVPLREGGADYPQRKTTDGVLAHKARPATGQQQNFTARLQLSDAELARQMQRAELASAADAAGTTPSMLYPELLSLRSSRELTLDQSLSRAQSVRVNPRVAAAALPSEPVVSADRQRLLATLRQYDLVEREVAGDGNCQFRALSDQLYGTPEHHAAVRMDIVATLRQGASSYSCYVPEEFGKYCSSMARSGTWGDHVTLQAAADHYGLRIMVVTSFAESPVIYIDPAQKRSPRTLYLSFWAEVHYNSLYPAQEPPPPPVARPPPPDPVAGKPPKVLGSRTLGRVVQEMEKVTEKVTEVVTAPLPGLLGYRTTSA